MLGRVIWKAGYVCTLWLGWNCGLVEGFFFFLLAARIWFGLVWLLTLEAGWVGSVMESVDMMRVVSCNKSCARSRLLILKRLIP